MVEKIRHSLAHIMAQAVQRIIDPNVKLWIGPAIDNWFYYDFDTNVEISDKNLKKIEKEMKNIIKENQNFVKITLDPETAENLLKLLDQPYKLELLKEFVKNWEEISFYYNSINLPEDKIEKFFKSTKPEYVNLYKKVTNFLKEKINLEPNIFVTFIDLCEWPHVENTNQINPKAFKLVKVAWAYRRWDENNPMLTRIYWYAFQTPEELQNYLKFLEEAKKRDHRILWPKLWLYTIKPDEVGAWLILWKPKWATLYNILAHFIENECNKRWYVPVRTPHIGKKTLWEISGHWGFYNESMYPPLELWQTLEDWQDNRKPKESEIYLLKPMNCPFHVMIYKDDIHSYKELPIRYWEFWTVYRYEKKWELWWLTRVRWFTQDDAHIICRPNQIKDEISKTVDFVLDVLKTFDFKDIKIFVSLSDPNSNKYVGDKNMWKLAESTIEEVLKEKWLNYEKEIWEAAFYWPKIDFKIKDALWRLWQCSTIQFDFNLPERFDMYYINEEW
jgi:threonyl-tRNA synthetase